MGTRLAPSCACRAMRRASPTNSTGAGLQRSCPADTCAGGAVHADTSRALSSLGCGFEAGFDREGLLTQLWVAHTEAVVCAWSLSRSLWLLGERHHNADC